MTSRNKRQNTKARLFFLGLTF